MTSRSTHRLVRGLIRLAISGLFLVIFGLHVQGSQRLELVDRIESYLYDARVQLTMPDTVDDRIVIVEIDEASLSVLGQWPWSRDTLAGIVDALFDDYLIHILGFDVFYVEEEETSGKRVLDDLAATALGDLPEFQAEYRRLQTTLDRDTQFAESFIARDVVPGFLFKYFLAADEPEATGELPPPLIRGNAIAGWTVPFLSARGYVGNLAQLQQNAETGGFVDTPLIDADGVFRRTPLVQRYRGDLYPTLSLAIARLALGSPPVSFVFATSDPNKRSGLNLEAFRLGEQDIAVDEQAAVFIPFRGRQGSFNYVSARSVLDGTAPRDKLEGKIVLFGATAAGLHDLRSTPVGKLYAGVEAHANLIAGLLDGTIKQQPSYSAGLELVVLVVLALLTGWVLPGLGALAGLLMVLSIVAVALAGNLWMWSYLGLVVPLASTLTYTLFVGLLQINYGYFIESHSKRQLSKVFGQYVPLEIVEELEGGSAELSLEGETRDMSVLFTDVRGFTSISEKLDAKELTLFMNEFLTPVTTVIHEHRGTIDKYMGDAVMAFWGAPLEDAEHARNAVIAGLALIQKTADLGEPFKARGWPPIAVGVGVSSGDMNVGNMGSEFRMAYTVMGDTVNLGSRLEGLTKHYGVQMIVSEGTMRKVPDVAFRELDLVRVKGKFEPVAIYEPLGPEDALDDPAREVVARFAEIIKLYRAQDWDGALSLLRLAAAQEDELLYNRYLERIELFRKDPPPPDWDGVFEHLSK
ncbi:MAG: adenylate/guanylate cyclase domain-containing protein [Gammaproteobacteria bacterium]|nr:adenylate/guanylate cyclase domain-containing protein [Gammaproteobacteria bacterium]